MNVKKILLRKRRKKESLFKYISGLLHLWLGLLSSLVILVVCLTGCMYAFKNQINDFQNRNQVFIETKSEKLPLSYFEDKLKKENQQINSILIPKNPSRSVVISFFDIDSKNIQTHYFNPYTGEDLGSGNGNFDGFFNTVEALHKNLLMGDVGKHIVGVFVLVFIFMLLSGLVLWWPKRKKKLVKQAFTIKWKAKFYRINYDLHNTLGFYSLAFLLFISVTGIYITYPWVKTVVLVSLGGESISEQTQSQEGVSDSFANLMDEMLKKENEKMDVVEIKQIPLDSILYLTQKELSYPGTTTILLPDEKEPRYRIQKINTSNWLGAMLPDFIDFDRNGELKRSDLFKNKPLHQQFKELSKPLHTGEIMGTSSVIFYFLITLIGFSLPITGFIIWWKKVK